MGSGRSSDIDASLFDASIFKHSASWGADERQWVAARFQVVANQLANADPQWAAWGRRELASGVGEALVDAVGWDSGAPSATLKAGYDRIRQPGVKVRLGQVFTPAPLARLLARISLSNQWRWPEPTILDPACGAGSLLVAAAEWRFSCGLDASAAIADLEGWDRDPVAAWLCRAALVEWALSKGGAVPAPLRIFGGVDALNPGPLDHPVGAWICNPPYLEAKRMGRAEPGLRDRLRRVFPELKGAWDLYLAFCLRALAQVGEGGSIGLLLPNKVL
ncbi:MAG: N-6 DNA methylase, partial [Proteobacteria bacterium]|nr:N-6 DNA methylase [Pseudomonadota bacterium]